MEAGPVLGLPVLMLVTDRRQAAGRGLDESVALAVEGGVDMVQLREKDLSAAELWELARRLKEITRGKALLAINDRVDVALAVGAEAVHLAARSLPTAEARRVGGAGMLVGRSVRSAREARQAETEGADYVVVGTIFATTSKPGAEPGGPGLLSEVCGAVQIPVLAIGGITQANIEQTVEAGGAGAAVISAILGSPDPRGAARHLRRKLDDAWAKVHFR